MYNFTLQELLDLFDAQTINIAKFIENTYNDIVPETNTIDTPKATIIAKMLKNGLETYVYCKSIFKDANQGVNMLKRMIKTNIFGIVMEYERIDKSLNKGLLTNHKQSRFNPIDNQDVEESPTKIDDTDFNYLDNYNAKFELLCKSTAMINFIQDVITILYTMD